MESVTTHPFTKFDKDWALVCAGTKDKFNACTVSWGCMGTLWSVPVVQIFIKPVRYTAKFLEESEYFTVSFYDKKYKTSLGTMGYKSGRNCDKVKEAGLTPKFLEHAVTFEEASETFVCKKIYMCQMDKSKFPEFSQKFYAKEGEEPAHFVIFGQLETVNKK